MTTRVLTGAAAGWVSLHLLLYTWLVRSQGGEVAPWYLAVEVLAVLACLAAAAGVVPATATTLALVLAVVATVAGLLSIGVLLVPADLALAATVLRRRSPAGRRLA